ncbi:MULTISPECIES: sensor histidine kinase [unclassified Bradyrhizobium]|uniref:sensor histidine kinase n=1 Tax=unclassified Bradyrhizobium TaxID=2631580 RepID=UPI001BAE48FA|nr:MULTISPECIES: sensor histidine kinase [unclassified Bradyrhizobium]MBR1223934.1 sensor histidine kinase [Bradyrhizobium sp. AUGA SZCCT0176]MBR1233540.1 sensor histidine kinase [Bradyrhizobium sp. AUGA SZCCT0182]MBR1283369.1 sensor histidine kinase [Bradyrhizobium sp. AUGA SZCCT0177]MBR1298362.1 sensor histidine kinase [Bradyrhizobium sp. AUGA SZCCT0042]
MPKLSLPMRLVLLVAGTTLPLIIFAAGIVFNNYGQDRKDATQRVLETVRGIRLVLDAEMQRMTGGLQVLSLTNALRDRDFDGFRRIATGFLEQYGRDGVVLVADREGRQLFSSVTPDTATLPLRNNLDLVEKVFATKRPYYSNLFTGVVKKGLIVTVEVPVIRDGEVIYDISFSPPIEIFQEMIEKQLPGKDWTISIFDGEGTNFARVPNPQNTIGQRASPSLYAELFRKPEGTFATVSLEGVPLITGVARSSLTGWTVAGGIAESSLVAPLWRSLAITSVIGGVLLLVGLAFAVRMATAIARGEMLHDLLIDELNHRVKNTLAILQSITTQTFRSASRAEREKFEGRLGALAEAHNLLSQEKWQGSELQDVIARVLKPYLLNNPDRVRMFGPMVPLSPRLAVVLSMIVHEIATNAAKYGALSNDSGTVALDWEIIAQSDGRKLRMIWTESGGPHVSAPVQRGFGSRLIERSARDQLGGEATVDFLPRGVVCTVTAALEQET